MLLAELGLRGNHLYGHFLEVLHFGSVPTPTVLREMPFVHVHFSVVLPGLHGCPVLSFPLCSRAKIFLRFVLVITVIHCRF